MDTIRHLHAWHKLPDSIWSEAIESAVRHRLNRRHSNAAKGKSLGMVFFNSSLRTRASMELAAVELGAHATVMNVGQGLWGLEWRQGVYMDGMQAEHIREAFGVLSRYYQALGVRVFAGNEDYDVDRDDLVMERIIASSSVPVVNLESAFYHPCQALGDAATLTDHFDGDLKSKKFVLTWTPHVKPLPMAVANSAILMATRLGFDVTIARPETHALDRGILSLARAYAKSNGKSIEETTDQGVAFEDASVIYAKSWGGPLVYSDPEREARIRTAERTWTVSTSLMAKTADAVFMHCLPVRRNLVVADEVIDADHAIHLQQAEYRLHAQKAILSYLWDL